MTASLRGSAWGVYVSRVLAAALQAVEPGEAVRRFVQRQGKLLTVAGRAYALDAFRRVLVVGAGKAGAPMGEAVATILGEYLSGGTVIVKEGYARGVSQLLESDSAGDRSAFERINILEASHPLPDQRGVAGARRIMQMLESAGEQDLVFCLISGGGSALMASPIQGVTLDDLQKLTSLLLACGATINEINALRKHLDEVKGGKLARLARPSRMITLILSDVVGDPLDVIASGPTVPDPATFATAYGILEKYRLVEQTPTSILVSLRKGMNGQVPETPKEGDPIFNSVQNVIVGNNSQAAQAALAAARAAGFHSLLLTTYLQGEARQAGRLLAAIARQVASSGQPLPRPACLAAGGETTVTLMGDGLGGRNQELALGAVADLAGLQEVTLVTLATDGGDGPTDAAGAVVTGETLSRAAALGMRPQDFLERSDSYHFFEPLGDLLKPGPTQTNVNDLAFLFAF